MISGGEDGEFNDRASVACNITQKILKDLEEKVVGEGKSGDIAQQKLAGPWTGKITWVDPKAPEKGLSMVNPFSLYFEHGTHELLIATGLPAGTHVTPYLGSSLEIKDKGPPTPPPEAATYEVKHLVMGVKGGNKDMRAKAQLLPAGPNKYTSTADNGNFHYGQSFKNVKKVKNE